VVPPASHRIPRAPWYSGSRFGFHSISPTGLSPPPDALSRTFGYAIVFLLARSYNPNPTTHRSMFKVLRSMSIASLPFSFNVELRTQNVEQSVVGLVWALPRSLATTEGISLDFFSSRY
jgi:hypothetical protein